MMLMSRKNSKLLDFFNKNILEQQNIAIKDRPHISVFMLNV